MNHFPDVPQLSASVWPYDTNRAPGTGTARRFDKLRCFVLCPFARSDIVMHFVREAKASVSQLMNHEVEAYFAGDIGGSGAIHPDIWAHIRQADLVIADLTGYNPNVVYEFGVTAASRPIDTVIIFRDKSDGQQIAFDLQPARHILYDSTQQGWMDDLLRKLEYSMVQCLAGVPFRDEPDLPTALPFDFSFGNGMDTSRLWSPGPCHRRLIAGAVEFGSPFYFPYSWLNPVGLRPTNIRVRAELRFTVRFDPSWIGIAVRSQGYLAHQEYLIWLNSDGTVLRTGPGPDASSKDEHELGRLSDFDPNSDSFVSFDVCMNSLTWSINVGGVQQDISMLGLPHVFGPGRILVQACRCRAALSRIRIDEISG